MGFRHAEFPWHTSVFDGGEGRSACSAGVPSDYQVVGSGLGHASRNGTHTDFRTKLDANAGLRVRVFKVMDQLGHILDRINIVVWGRGYETNPWRRMTQARDIIVYLAPGQLAALSRFSTLNNFDLQFVSVAQVVDSDAEPTAGYLLNRRPL